MSTLRDYPIVSTEDYRKGWDLIWGKPKPPPKPKKPKKPKK